MFLYHKWMELNINTRHAIAAQFGIEKKGSTEVFNNTIKSDGYLVKDVEQALNIDALQEYLGTHETDMMILWMWLVEKIEGKELTQVNMDTTIPTVSEAKHSTPVAVGEECNKPKRGRPKK